MPNILTMNLGDRSYDILVSNSTLDSVGKFINLERKVAIITDSGVPEEYSKAIASQCKNAIVITFDQGEENKNLETYKYICEKILDFGLERSDAIVAVGGGVVGDISGFVASTYMRGIDFYNIPTTLLSQVDSSIGGKTAIDFCGVKNILGSFYQPKAVIISTDTLRTLDKRQISSGIAEVIKMSLTSDEELFKDLEEGLFEKDKKQTIIRALKIKKSVVEADEKENSIRKILNFGHTFGHGIEALGNLYHGECVALGMIPMCEKKLRPRLINLLSNFNLPTSFEAIDIDKAAEFIQHDKKSSGGVINVVFVDSPGSYRIEKMSAEEILRHIKSSFG